MLPRATNYELKRKLEAALAKEGLSAADPTALPPTWQEVARTVAKITENGNIRAAYDQFGPEVRMEKRREEGKWTRRGAARAKAGARARAKGAGAEGRAVSRAVGESAPRNLLARLLPCRGRRPYPCPAPSSQPSRRTYAPTRFCL